ncbi:glycosyltransferase family 4 protein [Flavobacteriaceae bacterium]|nr:glycosyltransferase family 4 protein [Flavobacteriaceae bacterium]
MKILVISQYFYPENFRINDLVFSLNKRGHQIEVLTGKPNYPKGNYFEGYSWDGPKQEEIEGIKVHRANLILRKKGGGIRLFLNYFSFIFFGLFKILKLKGDFEKIFIYAPSPITVGILGIVAAKKFKCKSYLWVHDLWPESVRVAGGIKSDIILGIVNQMTKLIYRYTDLLLVQSPEFKNYILNQGVEESKIIYYPYYAEDFYKVVEKDKSYLSQFPKGLNLLFAGNIGVAQSFDTIVNAFEKLKKYDINLVVLGDGRDKSRIQDKINEKGLTGKFYFLGSFPPEQMPYYFTSADGLLITLKKADIFSFTIPGKLQSYLACGKPIIGALDGIGNKIISESNSGFASEAENHELLAKNILTLYKLSKAEKEKLSNNALTYFDKNFNKQYLLERLEEILN